MDVMDKAAEAMTVRRVFGEPLERNGVTVIPAARLGGGAGSGRGQRSGEQAGAGGGFGLAAEPAGALVIKGDDVRWHPAVNLNRIIMGGQIVAVVALLTLRAIVRARSRR